MTYRNCRIFKTVHSGGLFVWEELTHGAESDDAFETVEAAKANIDWYFMPGPAVIAGSDNELSLPA